MWLFYIFNDYLDTCYIIIYMVIGLHSDTLTLVSKTSSSCPPSPLSQYAVSKRSPLRQINHRLTHSKTTIFLVCFFCWNKGVNIKWCPV